MKVFGLQGPLYRNARAASRIEANERSEKAKSRDAALRRWHEARRNGLTASNAAKAVSVPVSTLYAWDKARRRGGLKALEPRSTAPRKRRAKTWKTETLTALEDLRNDYPMWGKRKLVVLLRRDGHDVSESTVGRMLAYLVARGAIQPVPELRKSAPRAARRKRPHATRLPKKLKITRPGQLVQIDTMTITLGPGNVVKPFTAYDPVAKWTVARARRRATAGNTKAFLDELIIRLPFRLDGIQVDGGSEFMAEFEAEAKRRKMTMHVTPPRRPDFNGHVERNNATWRYEFYGVYDLPNTLDQLNPLVDAFAQLHNTFRPHNALAGLTPLEYLNQRNARTEPQISKMH